MDLLKDDIFAVYRKFLIAAFGSAFMTSIFSLVDTAVVGQYHGPVGVAAMAVIAPVWNILFSLGLLAGIGGSVLYAVKRGARASTAPANRYFTAALLIGAALSITTAVGLFLFDEPLLRLFGGEGEILELSLRYMVPVKWGIPLFIFANILMAFIRNDGNPKLATLAVLAGGIFNVFGDYFFVFTCEMGIFGAGLATLIGEVIAVSLMSTHFLRKHSTLRIEMPLVPVLFARQIVMVGFSTFFIDIAMGLLTMLFNRQILRYMGTDELAVYGVVVMVSTFVQCCGYGIGQGAQPILSQNHGAGASKRVSKTLRYAIWTSALVSAVWLIVLFAVPDAFVRIFMRPTESVLTVAPSIVRIYALAFVFLPLNVFSTYYFQATLRPRISFAVSIARGFVIPAALLILLPCFFGGTAIWWAVPLAEFAVAIAVIYALRHPTSSST